MNVKKRSAMSLLLAITLASAPLVQSYNIYAEALPVKMTSEASKTEVELGEMSEFTGIKGLVIINDNDSFNLKDLFKGVIEEKFSDSSMDDIVFEGDLEVNEDSIVSVSSHGLHIFKVRDRTKDKEDEVYLYSKGPNEDYNIEDIALLRTEFDTLQKTIKGEDLIRIKWVDNLEEESKNTDSLLVELNESGKLQNIKEELELVTGEENYIRMFDLHNETEFKFSTTNILENSEDLPPMKDDKDNSEDIPLTPLEPSTPIEDDVVEEDVPISNKRRQFLKDTENLAIVESKGKISLEKAFKDLLEINFNKAERENMTFKGDVNVNKTNEVNIGSYGMYKFEAKSNSNNKVLDLFLYVKDTSKDSPIKELNVKFPNKDRLDKEINIEEIVDVTWNEGLNNRDKKFDTLYVRINDLGNLQDSKEPIKLIEGKPNSVTVFDMYNEKSHFMSITYNKHDKEDEKVKEDKKDKDKKEEDKKDDKDDVYVSRQRRRFLEDVENLAIVESKGKVVLEDVFKDILEDNFSKREREDLYFDGDLKVDRKNSEVNIRSYGLYRFEVEDYRGNKIDLFLYVKDTKKDSPIRSIKINTPKEEDLDKEILLEDIVDVTWERNVRDIDKTLETLYVRIDNLSSLQGHKDKIKLTEGEKNTIEVFDMYNEESYKIELTYKKGKKEDSTITDKITNTDEEEEVETSPILKSKYFHDIDSNHWAFGAITTVTERGLIHGYPNRMYYPEREMSVREFLTMHGRLIAVKDTNTVRPVIGEVNIPINENQWGYVEAQNVLSRINPNKLAKFNTSNLNRNITREEASFLLANTFNMGNSGVKEGFKDIGNSKFSQEINSLKTDGLIEGFPDKTFRPSKTMTRAEAAAFIGNISNAKTITPEVDLDLDDGVTN